MHTKGRRKNPPIIEQLSQEPQLFSFVQAVRLLERGAVFRSKAMQVDEQLTLLPATNSIARFTPPNTEFIRFRNNSSLSFPFTEINKLKQKKNKQESDPLEFHTNFLGLTGSQGTLPFHYTEMVLQRLRLKDDSLLEFLDLFNHRIISLFYQASVKYSLPIEYERKRLPHIQGRQKEKDTITEALKSIIGFGTQGLNNRLHISDESLIYFGGLLSQQVRSTTGLKQMLEHYFDIPVKIEEFIGRWQELIDDIRSKLPDPKNPKGQNVCLGRSAMLGKRGWFAQGKVRVVLGPLNQKQFYKFAPGTSALKALNEIVRTYIGIENDYDFKILVKRSDIPDKIMLDRQERPIMGWNTWLASKPTSLSEKSKTMKISISASQLN